MTPLACAEVLRQLQAYHDEELPVAEQMGVSAHLDGCESCRMALSEYESKARGIMTRASSTTGRITIG